MSKRPTITESKIVDDSDTVVVALKKGHTVFLQFLNDKEEIEVVLSIEHDKKGDIRTVVIEGIVFGTVL